MPENIVALSIGVTVPFVILCVLSFALRIYSRVWIAKSFGADDWMMVAAFVFWIGQQLITYQWVRYGAGRHMEDVSAEDYLMLRTYLFVEEFYYLFEQLLIKLSFLLFYLRFLGMTKFRYTIYATMALVILQVVGTWIFYALQCQPVGAFLHPELYPDAICVSSDVAYYAPTAANVFVDVVIYTIPIYPLWKLQATLKKRLGLIAVMTLGGCTILVSGLRFIVLWQLATHADFTYIFGRVVIVTTIEFVTAIVTANMPALKTIWKYHVSKDLHSMQGAHELGCYDNSGSRGTDPRLKNERLGPSANASGRRPTSPTDSEQELVDGKGTNVIVTSQWAVRSDSRSAVS